VCNSKGKGGRNEKQEKAWISCHGNGKSGRKSEGVVAAISAGDYANFVGKDSSWSGLFQGKRIVKDKLKRTP
jgi:hypothetical protein